MVVSLSSKMNEETATVDFLCPTVDRATGTLRRLIHRVVLLCAAASYLLSLPLQVTFLEFLPWGETPRKRGVLLLPVVLLLSAQTLVMVAKNLREWGRPPFLSGNCESRGTRVSSSWEILRTKGTRGGGLGRNLGRPR